MADTVYRRRSNLIAIPSSPPRPRPLAVSPRTPSPPSSPATSPRPPSSPAPSLWPLIRSQISLSFQHHLIIRRLSPRIRTLLNSRKRNIEQPRLDLMEYHLNENPAREAPPISGSFCSNCFRYVLFEFMAGFFWDIVYKVHIFRTKRVVPSSSSGPTGRRASSSWWTARRCPGCGACTRTSPTWTTRRWGEHSGKS